MNTKNSKKIVLTVLTAIIVISMLTAITTPVSANGPVKSVFLVADHHASPTPINAHLTPTLGYQGTHYVTSHQLGASGLAMYDDPNGDGLYGDAQILVTYEASGIIEVFNATDFTPVMNVDTGASDLTGIVVDQGNKLVYVSTRSANSLYILNATTLNLIDTITLTTITRGWGVGLDETKGWLFVADGDNTVHYFNTTTWLQVGTITIEPTDSEACGIAVDAENKFVYVGGAFLGDWRLYKYDYTLGTVTKNVTLTGPTGTGVMGLAVDPDDPYYLYVTTGYSGDDLRTFDSDLNQLYATTENISNPAGICIGRGAYMPQNQLWHDIEDELDALIVDVDAAAMPNIIKQRLLDKLVYAKALRDNAKIVCHEDNFDAATKKLGVAKNQVESFASMVKITRRISAAAKAGFLADAASIIAKIDALIEYIETEQRC